MITHILVNLISVYLLILVARAVLDVVQVMARGWSPRGAMLVIANLIYTLTDPPLRALGKVIPPLRLGGVALDMGFLVLLFGLQFLQRILIVFF